MVREGRMAKMIACREAEVKSPVPGHPRTPVDGVFIDGMATSRQVRAAGEIPLITVRKGENQGKISAACIQNAILKSSVQENSPTSVVGREPEQMLPGLVETGVSPVGEKQPARADSSLTLAQLFSEAGIIAMDEK